MPQLYEYTIQIINNVKYRVYNIEGKKKEKCCIKENCYTLSHFNGYCKKHIDGKNEIKKVFIEENGMKIQLENGYRYKLLESGRSKICNFKDITCYKLALHGTDYCKQHKDGIDHEKFIPDINAEYKIVEIEGKRYRVYEEGKRYKTHFLICKFPNCDYRSMKEGYCNKHEGGIEKIKIKEVECYDEEDFEGKKYKIKIIDNIKYRVYKTGTRNRVRFKACQYKDCENIAQRNNYCKKHEDGKDYVKKERKPTVIIKDDGKVEFTNAEYREKCKNYNKEGDEREKYIFDIISNFDTVEECKHIGTTSDRLDIIFKLKDETFWRGVQVKSFFLEKQKTYRCTLNNNYKDDTLIVCVNKNDNKYGIIPFGETTKTCVSISFLVSKCKNKYKKYGYENEDDFKVALKEKIKTTTVYECSIPKTGLQEQNQLLRLKNKCDELKYTYEEKSLFSSIYDCVINNKKIQCKVTTREHGNMYDIGLSKTYIRDGKKQLRRPYSINDDIEYFIFEIETAPNNFYIIPKQMLYDKGYLQSDTQKGRFSILIPPIGYEGKSKSKWMLDYINKFELLL